MRLYKVEGNSIDISESIELELVEIVQVHNTKPSKPGPKGPRVQNLTTKETLDLMNTVQAELISHCEREQPSLVPIPSNNAINALGRSMHHTAKSQLNDRIVKAVNILLSEAVLPVLQKTISIALTNDGAVGQRARDKILDKFIPDKSVVQEWGKEDSSRKIAELQEFMTWKIERDTTEQSPNGDTISTKESITVHKGSS